MLIVCPICGGQVAMVSQLPGYKCSKCGLLLTKESILAFEEVQDTASKIARKERELSDLRFKHETLKKEAYACLIEANQKSVS